MSRDDLPPSINFSEEEEKIIQFHNEIEAFKTSCRLSAKRPPFTFYDGPPFATGLPHYGHILAGTIKDVVTRFAYSEGYHVERHFGWDCHGLPVEYEVDKLNNISGPQDVDAMGVAAYNAKCREIVMRYSLQWRSVVQRIGRWIDFDDDYRTMYPTFMESVWWVFKQLYEKGLVYRGVKVMPFSTACSTPLSNFEAGLNYKDVQDPAIAVSFPVEDFDNSTSTVCVELLAWTTTPWTLPSNLALCVNPEKDYVKIKDKSRDRVFIIMECRLEWFYKKVDDYEVLEKMKGKKLIGLKYKPLFDYFIGLKELRGAFRVVGDAYVTEETGTGVVHQAPYFGEDDFRVCLREGIVTKEMAAVCPVDASGRFTAEVKDFAGQYVKDADRSICQHLKHAGRLVQQSTLQHSYPFCWRSDTPLLYKAVPTWFVRVECLVERLLANSAATYWVPEFIKEKRFANWLKDARDWAISRNRYWGTPIPLWVSEDFDEVVCIGSVDELERLSGHCVTDLHKEFVDPITIPSRMGKGELRRISEVFDCWFESGSMPYAQMHYPFENAERFNSGFPADFVAEGVDQTRGWFYTLFVLSTALFNQPPFRNLIVNGIVLASDGQKMSKRQKNYPDPCKIVEQYGADALRLYLVNSPVVRAQSLRFSEWGVRDVLKDVFIPWYNAFRFLMKSGIEPWERVHGTTFRVRAEAWPKSRNLMDRWILSFTQSLLLFVRTELRAYRLYTVVPRLVCFIEQLVNWYIRMNRRRLKGEAQATLTANGATMDAEEDWYGALHTLVKVFFQLIFVMAPFAPFFTEFIYQRLKAKLDFSEFPLDGVSDAESGAVGADGAPASVHYLVGVSAESGGIDIALEEQVAWMQAAVELGRSIRTRHDLPLKAPLPAAVVIHPLAEAREAVTALASYVTEELNIRNLTVTDDKTTYRVRLRARLNPVLGARLRARLRLLAAAVAALPQSSLEAYLTTGEMTVEGERLSGDDVTVDYVIGDEDNDENNIQAKKLKAKLAENGKAPVEVVEGPKYKAQADGKGLLVLLDVGADTELEEERVARELINRIQRARKKGNLVPEDAIQVVVSTMSEVLAQVLTSHTALIDATVKQPIVCCTMEDAALTAATAAVQARGERLGDIVVSDATSIPPDDLVVTIFHRIAATKDTASHSTTAASKSHVPGVHSSMRSLKVRCPVVDESIDVCLVDATGKQLISGVVELLDVVRGAFDWRLAANLRLMHSGTELTCDSTVNVLNLAGQELCLL
ncbi:isoleucyl tRNA synthetase, cytoplasmic [Echinococcus multilocularis]|uniref:Isoleucine--tRNA ligase, cytoplasmic n=1 Tax=Echinococcus multilocularis TaxID=6211 RepID=A0A068Y063_ECHMU|nr:isoleucyl tRNA synthetase, cytoplasmic [Echinococcus multilocularis]